MSENSDIRVCFKCGRPATKAAQLLWVVYEIEDDANGRIIEQQDDDCPTNGDYCDDCLEEFGRN